ncbi:uncharacterized protein KY384_002691 [Bacidia gigantensis]|uniref:uncharacterized protein n=1 Tax=Bacidia gigantensis TaxID=2732470 RepID=UPI001D037862|nr:uncharacterized protein KY384_002691 [Bacidia gigantensis]KAG8532813.1 hypothetical protein KY384_002691 [Bacidia gigantensis]
MLPTISLSIFIITIPIVSLTLSTPLLQSEPYESKRLTCYDKAPSLHPNPLTPKDCDAAISKFSVSTLVDYIRLISHPVVQPNEVQSPYTTFAGDCLFTLSLMPGVPEVQKLPKTIVEFGAFATIGDCIGKEDKDGGQFLVEVGGAGDVGKAFVSLTHVSASEGQGNQTVVSSESVASF